MDKETEKTLMRKVKKHKKWYEGVFINPIYRIVNNKPYYMAGFTVNDKPRATAYLTTVGEEDKEEAYAAQSSLSLFSDVSNNIFSIGGDHLKIDSNYYIKPLEIPVNTKDLKVLAGHEAFKDLWNMQQKFNRLILEFQRYYDELLIRGELTGEDIEKGIETANWVNLYQFETISILVKRNEDIRAYSAYLKTTKQWKKLSRNQKIFVEKIAGAVEELENNIRSLDLIIVEDVEKMIALNLEKAKNDLKTGIEKQKSYIRYPS